MPDWVGSWMTAHAFAQTDLGLENQTLRLVIRSTLGGSQLRLKFNNAFSDQAVLLGRVQIALRKAGADVCSETLTKVRFEGQTSVQVQGREVLTSDAVHFELAPLTELVVSIYLPEQTDVLSVHGDAHTEQYVSVEGDHTGAASFAVSREVGNWHLLAGLEVLTEGSAVVAFGDSITDGSCTEPGSYGRWTDLLAEKFCSAGLNLAVLNAGISGNRILHDNPDWCGQKAIKRIQWDVLSQSGVSHVIWLEGINDLMHPGAFAPESETVSAQQLIQAFQQNIENLHARGIRVMLGTILPFRGWVAYSEAVEQKRQEINQWIRTSGVPDGVIDFDAAVRDPLNPERMLPATDIGDHLHPNNTGFQLMAQAISLDLFATLTVR